MSSYPSIPDGVTDFHAGAKTLTKGSVAFLGAIDEPEAVVPLDGQSIPVRISGRGPTPESRDRAVEAAWKLIGLPFRHKGISASDGGVDCVAPLKASREAAGIETPIGGDYPEGYVIRAARGDGLVRSRLKAAGVPVIEIPGYELLSNDSGVMVVGSTVRIQRGDGLLFAFEGVEGHFGVFVGERPDGKMAGLDWFVHAWERRDGTGEVGTARLSSKFFRAALRAALPLRKDDA